MFDRIKNLKLVKQLKENVSPKLRWLTFSNKNKLDKSTTDYLENISGVDNLKALSDEQELEAMVRAQLKEEFPNIEKMKSYELLVDAVMHNIKNSSLAALLIGKIARASECNVKISFQENSHFKNEDIDIPSEALVTITGNLIDNALDSMNTRTNSTKELSIGIFTDTGKMLLIVQDSGTGIADGFIEKIFENGFSTKGTGRGVGLFHTKQLVESLGGEIYVESQVGKGSCFTVKLSR